MEERGQRQALIKHCQPVAAHPYLAPDCPLDELMIWNLDAKIKIESRDGSATQEDNKLLSFQT